MPMHHPASGMVLGCFIGVMILLAIIIIVIGIADNRINKMMTTQNNQIATFSSIERAIAVKHIADRLRA
jgi:hypothetical protein